MFKPAENSTVCLVASPAVVLPPSVSQARDIICSTYLKNAGSVPLGEGSIITDAWPNAVHDVVERNNTHASDIILAAEIPNILVVKGKQCRGYFLRLGVIVVGTDQGVHNAETSIYR